ncbi:MAG: hypothetical protein FWE71_10555 [Nocardioidaceae bacterium]|nr:hypothetical protein [Nocardioidaceae bacterium]MCL2612855.1 hypothetical protein [Nocardioidaceae bacterium]
MTRTSSRRLRSALVVVSLTAATTGTATAVTGPANAVSNVCPTATTLTINGKTSNQAVQYGATVTLGASVALGTCQFADGVPTSITVGTLEIDRITDGDLTVVKKIGVSSGSSSISISGKNLVPALSEYKAVYLGNSDDHSGDTYESSQDVRYAGPYRTWQRSSASRWVKGGFHGVYKINPSVSIKGLKVQLQRRTTSGWTTFAQPRVSSAGLLTYTFKAGVTRVMLPLARGFIASEWKVQVIIRRGRQAMRQVR